MKITIETIPHGEQRYPTIGDWLFDEAGDLQIRVSSMGNWKYEALVAHHELIEALLCKDRGITWEMVDAFDKEFNRRRAFAEGGEPGDAPDCPYRKEHFFATTAERTLAEAFDVDWFKYDAAVGMR